MSPQLQAIEEQALLLTPEDRETLVELLLQSLRQEALPEIDPAWIAEVEKRYAEYKSGEVEGIPAEQIFDDVRRELGWSA